MTFNLEKARIQLEEMQSDITSTGIRMVMYLFNKNMRRSIQGLHVDMRGVKMIKTVI